MFIVRKLTKAASCCPQVTLLEQKIEESNESIINLTYGYPDGLALNWMRQSFDNISTGRFDSLSSPSRSVKQRYYPMLGFGAIERAKCFCQAFDEVRQFLRPRARMTEIVSLGERRKRFLTRMNELQESLQAA